MYKDINRVTEIACNRLGVDKQRLFTRTRKREVNVARQTVWSICRELTTNKYTEEFLGAYFGDYGSSNVNSAYKKAVPDRLDTDSDYKLAYDDIFNEANKKYKEETDEARKALVRGIENKEIELQSDKDELARL